MCWRYRCPKWDLLPGPCPSGKESHRVWRSGLQRLPEDPCDVFSGSSQQKTGENFLGWLQRVFGGRRKEFPEVSFKKFQEMAVKTSGRLKSWTGSSRLTTSGFWCVCDRFSRLYAGGFLVIAVTDLRKGVGTRERLQDSGEGVRSWFWKGKCGEVRCARWSFRSVFGTISFEEVPEESNNGKAKMYGTRTNSIP